MKTFRYRAAIGLAVSLALSTAQARESSRSERVDFTIDAPSLVQALMQFTQQSGLQLMVPTGGAAELPAPKVVGNYTPSAALDRLLAGSAFRYEFANARTVAIRFAEVQPAGGPGQRNSDSLAADEAGQPDAPAASDAADPAANGRTKAVPEVLVRGSRVLNADIERTPDDVQPYVVMDRKVIEQSGAKNVEELLRRLPMNAPSASPSQIGGSFNGAGTSIALRGLGAGETLILVDGHRIAGWNDVGASGQPDLNSIPLAAIERIEVLPSTGSGIYGGSATGGVVNVVLRRDYSGVGVGLTYQNTFQGGGMNRRVDLSVGTNVEEGRTNILFSASYSDPGSLVAGDRDLIQRGRAQILRNDPDSLATAFPLPLGATPNIASSSGDPLVLKPEFGGTALDSGITHVSPGYRGVARDGVGGLANNAGKLNLDLAPTAQPNGGRGQSIVFEPTLKSVMGSVKRQFSQRVDAFLDVSASKSSGIYRTAGLDGSFFVSADAPNNPFTEDVLVTVPISGFDAAERSEMESRRAVAGFVVHLNSDWNAGFDYTWSRNRFSYTSPSATLSADASDAVYAGTIDVLTDPSVTKPNFLPYRLAQDTFGPVDTTLRDAVTRVSGPLFASLPGGPIALSALVGYRKESLGDFHQTTADSTTTNYGRWQSTKSVYLEARYPIFSAANAVKGIELLELQLAGRHDDYRIVGANSTSSFEPAEKITQTDDLSSTDPTVGFRYKPVSALTLRGSYATGFLPPALNQIVSGPPTTRSLAIFGLRDPLRGNERLGLVRVVGGGNPQLRPEQSESRSLGFIVTPQSLPGFRASVDWTRIDKTDNIVLLVPAISQTDLTRVIAFAPERITRGANRAGDQAGWPGPITGIEQTTINLARAQINAYDVALDYTFQSQSYGTFVFSGSGTRQVHQETQIVPSAPVADAAGLEGGIKWRGNATVSWNYRNATVAWTTRYFDSYWLDSTHEVNVTQGAAKIPSQIYHDLYFSYALTSRDGGALGNLARMTNGMELQAGVSNLFNKDPPLQVTDTTGYFYSNYGSPLGATYFVTLRANF